MRIGKRGSAGRTSIAKSDKEGEWDGEMEIGSDDVGRAWLEADRRAGQSAIFMRGRRENRRTSELDRSGKRGIKRPRQGSNLRPLRSKRNALIQLSYGAGEGHCSQAGARRKDRGLDEERPSLARRALKAAASRYIPT